MEILTDALGLASLPEVKWKVYKKTEDKDGKVIETEEITSLKDMCSWESCNPPLYVALMRRKNSQGEVIQEWGLASTRVFRDPAEAFDLYHKRTQIEERHRQLKLCWLLYRFTSTEFSLILMHVIFTILVYSLIQMYLFRKGLQHLANKTITTLRKEEQLGKEAVIVYSEQYFATLDVDEYGLILLELKEPAKKRLLKWMKEFKAKKIRAP